MNTIAELLDIKGEIGEIKQQVREQTGAFKYDDCYDDCLKIIDVHIARLEQEPDYDLKIADHLASYMGWPSEEILKLLKLIKETK